MSEYIPTDEHNPCLTRLAQALKLRDGADVPLSSLRFSAPTAQHCERSFFCLANTSVNVWSVDNPAVVTLTYNRVSLETLNHDFGPVQIDFTPIAGGMEYYGRLLRAISAHYKRSIGLYDVEIDCYESLQQSPNGKWTMHLRASENSFGWTGEYMVVFEVNADLTKAPVKALDGFTYIRPPRPTDPDLTTGANEMNGFDYTMPIDLSKADVTALPPFDY